MERYDAVVIGGGPGGYVSAIRLSQLGFKTLLVEKEELGGECTNHGCIPSKHIITQANRIWDVRELDAKKIVSSTITVNMSSLTYETKAVVERIRQGIGFLLKEYGVNVVKAVADVVDNHTVKVNSRDGKTMFETSYIVVATGTEPSTIPTIPTDQNRVIDYRKLLFLQELPRKMLVVGGGAVGVELGMAFARLGTSVTVVEIMDQLLPGMDADAARAVKRGFEKVGARVFLKTSVDSYQYVGERVRVTLTNGESDEYDYVLVSVGKRPTSWVRKLADIGVELDGKGFVKTDETMRTSLDNVYAVGDITGPPFLAHKAHRQGEVAAEAIAGRDVKFVNVVPFGVFTSPEVAQVGMGVEEAAAKGHRARAVRFPYSALGRAVADGADGFVKLVADERAARLLGAVVVGPHATEVISSIAPYVILQEEAEKALKNIPIHPTYSEAVGEAVHMLLRKAVHFVVR
ncbi:MAG: dihydrolipoyl dehydrogenase [Candidatus Caldarchaeum sp.]|uniref:Dihydrolipoyl dehydrogenase n=1 Tax=Caldiarchaeum subterraneum TaxID=311458 RepID=A0A7C5QDR8_CALS0